ncbi:hypothetical protein [Inquilinus sp.]|uniref:hypothetical protein n=1 Tax=Inquilinus sp. TaxID=1932117 RepID=UPI0031D49053
MLTANRRGHPDMTAGEIRLPAYGTDPGTAKAAERQAREARQDAERYARRGNMTMHAISLQAAKVLEAAAATHRIPAPKARG